MWKTSLSLDQSATEGPPVDNLWKNGWIHVFLLYSVYRTLHPFCFRYTAVTLTDTSVRAWEPFRICPGPGPGRPAGTR